MKKQFAQTIILFVLGINSYIANDFDVICSFFQSLEKELSSSSMSQVQRGNYIKEKIDSALEESSPAKVAWDAISVAVPEQRYDLFKSGTEDALATSWECEPMRKLAETARE
jgi:hypothetical protein